MENKIIGILAVLGVLLGGVSLYDSSKGVLGAESGPEKTEHQVFLASFTQAGRHATTTNDTTSTLVEATFKDVARVDFIANVPGITATLPATSTLTRIVPRAGDRQQVLFCNATSTAATPVTLAAGTGMNLIQATSTLAIPTGDCATLIFSRQADTDIDVLYDLGY